MTHPANRRWAALCLPVVLALWLASPGFAWAEEPGAEKGGGEKAAGSGEGKEKEPEKPAEKDPELKRILALLDKTHKKIESLSAEFEQTRKSRISRRLRKSKGKLYLKKEKNKTSMKILFVDTEPFRSRVLFTDTEVVYYDEESKEIKRSDPRKGGVRPSEIWVLGRPVSEIEKYYTPKRLPLEEKEKAYMAKLELTPTSEKIRKWVTRIIVWLRKKDGLGVKVRILGKKGEYQELAFRESRLKVNPDLEDDLFKIP